MRIVKSIAPEYFDEVRKMLMETKDKWRIVLKNNSEKLLPLEKKFIDEIVDKDLWGEIPTVIATKGSPELPVKYREYLEKNAEDTFLFRYDDDSFILVANPDDDIARRFPLADASWYYSK